MTEARGALPPKLYFRIGEVAGLVGVEPPVLRYWEREFRTMRPSLYDALFLKLLWALSL